MEEDDWVSDLDRLRMAKILDTPWASERSEALTAADKQAVTDQWGETDSEQEVQMAWTEKGLLLYATNFDPNAYHDRALARCMHWIMNMILPSGAGKPRQWRVLPGTLGKKKPGDNWDGYQIFREMRLVRRP
jgi:hypothetical protein